jgi:hypothetical protein
MVVFALEVTEGELAQRRAQRAMPLPQATGYLSIYQRSVQPMSTSAVLMDTTIPAHQ